MEIFFLYSLNSLCINGQTNDQSVPKERDMEEKNKKYMPYDSIYINF